MLLLSAKLAPLSSDVRDRKWGRVYVRASDPNSKTLIPNKEIGFVLPKSPPILTDQEIRFVS